ncbi:hypothetical protein [Runella limosa]|uniref:hypothetical protein n=1 Tax=Runella limosa TaxID=370978 RepID=UPI0003F8C065|nr:hypothetical protein [Runella limosa]
MSTEVAEYKIPKGIIDLTPVGALLIEQMQEVKRNPAAIPQAQSMSEIADRLVDIAVAQVKQGQMVIDLVKAKKDNDNAD